jgi:hypothetical protein
MNAKQPWFSDEPSLDVAATKSADYRDYLWPIWTVAASNEVGNEVSLSGKEARQQLENRFCQDFRTVDDALRPADEVAVGVLTLLLLQPIGVGFGLGVATGDISRTESVVTQSRTRTVMQRIVDRDQHVIDKRQNAFGARHTRKLSASGSIGGTYEGNISVSLTCESTEATWSNWHTEGLARISATYAEQLARWQSEQGCVRGCSAPAGAPGPVSVPPRRTPARQVPHLASLEQPGSPT